MLELGEKLDQLTSQGPWNTISDSQTEKNEFCLWKESLKCEEIYIGGRGFKALQKD